MRLAPPRSRLVVTLLAAALVASACVDEAGMERLTKMMDQTTSPKPDVLPVMQGPSRFDYPAALYAEGVQGNVMLRIFIDTAGIVHSESTTVVESSGHPPLDSAAVKGTQNLRFTPATLRDRPMAVSILFPVHYRHPDGPPMPGDNVPGQPATPTPAP